MSTGKVGSITHSGANPSHAARSHMCMAPSLYIFFLLPSSSGR
jgi:hypothetical protein